MSSWAGNMMYGGVGRDKAGKMNGPGLRECALPGQKISVIFGRQW